MRRLALLAFILFSCTAFAFADATQINLNGTPGSVTMTSLGTGTSVDLMFSTLGGMPNNASWQYDYVVQSLGKFTLTANANPITATLNSSGSWDVNMHGQTLAFSYVGNDGNNMTGEVVLMSMADGTNAPITLNGQLIVTGAAGSPLFTSLWPATSIAPMDFVFANQGYPWASDLAAMEKGATRTYTDISSGQVPHAAEPGAITLLGAGLVGLAGLIRKKK